MAAPSTNGAVITRLSAALYGSYLSNATYLEVKDTAAAKLAGDWLSADYAGKTDLQIATVILTNLGLSSIAGLDNYVAGQLTAAGTTSAAKGASLVTMLNGYSQMTADATYGVSSTSFNTKVASSLTLSQTDGALGGDFATADKVAVKAATIVLTTSTNPATGGADNVTGTSAGDRIVGTVDTTGTADSFDAGDIIDGGEGDDTLALTVVGAGAGPTVGGIVSNVETISITNANSASTALNLTNVMGAKSLSVGSGQDGVVLSVTGLTNIVDASLAGNGGLTMTYAAKAVAGTADAQKLTLAGVAPALSSSTSNTFTADGIETMNLSASVASRVNLAGTSLKTVNVEGAASAIVITAEPTVTTMDASKATGSVTFVATAATGLIKMVGGAGDDGLTFGGSLTRSVAIDGGEGKDKLSLGNTAFAADAFANVKNVEVIALNATAAATVDVKAVTGLSEVVSSVTQTAAEVTGTITVGAVPNAGELGITNLAGAGTGAAILTYQETSSGNATAYGTAAALANAKTVTVDNLASGATFTLESRSQKALYATDPTAFDLLGQGAVALSVFQAANAANTNDSIKLIVDNNSTYTVKNSALGASSAAKNLYVVDSVTVPNVENVSVNSTGAFGGNTLTSLAVTSANKITITGDQALTIGSGSTYTASGITVSSIDSVILDASAFTGKLSATISAVELAKFSGGIKGGTAADTLTIAVTADGTVDTATTGIETIAVRVGIDKTASIDFSGFSGATTKRVTTNADVAVDADTVTITGLSSGDTLQLQGTLGVDKLAIAGSGAGSTLKLDFSQDTTAPFVAADIALTRVGNLEINTTRVDGSDSNLTVAQQATTFTNGIDSANLKTLKVTGINDTANVLTLGAVANAAGAALLDTVDLSGFAGYLAAGGLVLDQTAGSKGVTISLNSATKAGTVVALANGTQTVAGVLLVADDGGSSANNVAGITLGVNSADTVVFSSSMAQDVVIGTFTGGVGATVATPLDKLNLSAMGVKMADLTFVNYDNGADVTTTNSVSDSVQISITGITGKIYIVGTISTALTEANFIF
jgi:hypothetical protein